MACLPLVTPPQAVAPVFGVDFSPVAQLFASRSSGFCSARRSRAPRRCRQRASWPASGRHTTYFARKSDSQRFPNKIRDFPQDPIYRVLPIHQHPGQPHASSAQVGVCCSAASRYVLTLCVTLAMVQRRRCRRSIRFSRVKFPPIARKPFGNIEDLRRRRR